MIKVPECDHEGRDSGAANPYCRMNCLRILVKMGGIKEFVGAIGRLASHVIMKAM